jgi:hypothetical protein
MVPGVSSSTLPLIDELPSEAERALHEAARCGDARLLRALLQGGVAVDVLDQRGRTGLMLAAERGHLDALRELVAAGAEIDRRDAGKLHWPALMHALHADRSEAAVSLLQWGADPCASDDSGYDALMIAASRGDRRVVQELLARGADPAAELFLGFTALDYAIGYGHTEVVRLLLSAAPHLRRRRNPARRAVLALAGNAGEEEIVELLA